MSSFSKAVMSLYNNLQFIYSNINYYYNRTNPGLTWLLITNNMPTPPLYPRPAGKKKTTKKVRIYRIGHCIRTTWRDVRWCDDWRRLLFRHFDLLGPARVTCTSLSVQIFGRQCSPLPTALALYCSECLLILCVQYFIIQVLLYEYCSYLQRQDCLFETLAVHGMLYCTVLVIYSLNPRVLFTKHVFVVYS